MNILWAAIYLLLTFVITILVFKFFGKTGIYIWICISIIISNVQSVKLIEIFGMTTALGNIAYSNIYLSTDILTEKYGKRAANKSVLFGFLSMVSFTVLMCLALLFIPGKFDGAQQSLVNIFSFVPRITIASLAAYLCSQFLDIFVYSKIKAKFNKLWLSNNGGTIISQIVDTIIFITVAYVGTVPAAELFVLMGTTYALKVIIAICDTPFIYISKRIKPKEVECEENAETPVKKEEL